MQIKGYTCYKCGHECADVNCKCTDPSDRTKNAKLCSCSACRL